MDKCQPRWWQQLETNKTHHHYRARQAAAKYNAEQCAAAPEYALPLSNDPVAAVRTSHLPENYPPPATAHYNAWALQNRNPI